MYGAYGSTATFNCEHTAYQSHNYHWQKKRASGGNYDYLNKNQQKYRDVNAKTLNIYNLDYTDSGHYRCYVPTPYALGQGQELIVTRK